ADRRSPGTPERGRARGWECSTPEMRSAGSPTPGLQPGLGEVGIVEGLKLDLANHHRGLVALLHLVEDPLLARDPDVLALRILHGEPLGQEGRAHQAAGERELLALEQVVRRLVDPEVYDGEGDVGARSEERRVGKGGGEAG